ncbi:MAG: helix-turn-helix domain-containing protein [Terriglobia bacterium]
MSITAHQTTLLRVDEAANALALRPKTIWCWIGQRKIAVHRVGRAVRIPQSEIFRILDEGYTPALEGSPQKSPRCAVKAR